MLERAPAHFPIPAFVTYGHVCVKYLCGFIDDQFCCLDILMNSRYNLIQVSIYFCETDLQQLAANITFKQVHSFIFRLSGICEFLYQRTFKSPLPLTSLDHIMSRTIFLIFKSTISY